MWTKLVVLGIALWSVAPMVSAAQVAVATGRAGELSVWRVLHEGRRAPADEALSALDPDACEGCGAIAQASARLDLREVTGRGARFVALGAVLEAPEATRAHLFLGLDAGVRIFVDGEERAGLVAARVREDEHHLALELPPGRHRLVLALTAPSRGSWALRARLLGPRFGPGVAPATLDLGRGFEDADALSAEALALRERITLAPLALHAWVGFPGGGPVTALAVSRQGATAKLTPLAGAWRSGVSSAFAVPRRGDAGSLAVNGRSRRVGAGLARDRRLIRAGAALAAQEAPAASRAPIAWRVREIARVLAEDDSDGRWRRWLERDARALTRALRRGDDPFGELRGYVRMAHRSRLDEAAQPYELFVPTGRRRGHDARDGWPLVVTLHGFKGNAGDFFRNTFGLSRNWQGGETLLAHGRHGTAPTEGPMVVVAPQARGQAMYRHAGEIDVLEVIADVRARLPIDPSRIYITGGSMGGTGAAYLPLRHPDLFAAAAPLAGYHDQRVRQDTHQPGLSPTEHFLMARLSDVDWAENAAHLPMLLVRGQRDRPLAWTRNLVERLRALDYEVEHREPDLRHNVWTETYADGAIFDWFARHRRPDEPRRVRLRTARERTRSAWWVTVARARPDTFGEVDARVEAGRVVATTEKLSGLVLDPPTSLVPAGPLEVEVDGESLRGARPLRLIRRDGAWRVRTTQAPAAPLGRPLRDVFHEPLVFVVGTRDPAHTTMNRLVAEHWARPEGWDVAYPIVDDVDVTEELRRRVTLVLVGPPSSNAVLASIADRLPIAFEEDAIRLGERRFTGEEVGAAFRATWPGEPERAVLVIAGPSPLGTWRSRSLPEVLAEYAIFDGGVANARGEMTCGGVKRDRVTGAGVGATANDTRHGAVPVPCDFLAHGFFGARAR